MDTGTDLLTNLLPQLGTSAIFLILLIMLWKAMWEKLNKKDEELASVRDKVLDAFKENAKAVQGLKNAVDNNTKAIESLNEK